MLPNTLYQCIRLNHTLKSLQDIIILSDDGIFIAYFIILIPSVFLRQLTVLRSYHYYDSHIMTLIFSRQLITLFDTGTLQPCVPQLSTLTLVGELRCVRVLKIIGPDLFKWSVHSNTLCILYIHSVHGIIYSVVTALSNLNLLFEQRLTTSTRDWMTFLFIEIFVVE